ncbi:MAG: hypothetical protein A2W99_17345 [Bacteroidetes bacterium GWF2_33_16]|nr:MAG: hypothetical protein A2X00_14485 [Bacteroidetes bacterium GWE2_32_14]OFY06807.1 MAG: hypothetical protein A2W99_17345 [Bacteroidetes bacterium GWF2_33_16]
MRIFLIVLFYLSLTINLQSQIIYGRILGSENGEPLEYASIGIVNTSFGVITDENGYFKLEAREQDPSSKVRVSMIGYKPQLFTIKELENRENIIKLIISPIEIAEIIIKPTTKERKVGKTGHNKKCGLSGWGGLNERKGYEIGTNIELGDQPVIIKSLHIQLHRQSFDTSFYRLHIREINDTIVTNELLTGNIIVSITNESGWAKIDLDEYNLVHSGEIAITLEWLRVAGNNTDRAMKINDRIHDAYILFKNQKNHYGIYRWGTEAKWTITKTCGPSIYLTIKE